MRIGVDACCWSNARGYGRFTRELLRTLVARAPDDEFVCFADTDTLNDFDLDAPNVRRVGVPLSAAPTQAASAGSNRSPMDMLRLTRAVWREPLDVFFSPSVYTYFPLPPRLRSVVAIHDAIAERFPELTLPSRRARLFWRAKVRLAVWQAQRILTVSNFASRELASVLRIPTDRIRVAEEAPAEAYRPSEDPSDTLAAAERLGLPADARWIVYVGGFNPHKHVDLIVRAHAEILRRQPGLPLYLLLVGSVDSDTFHGDVAKIRGAIDEIGTVDRVLWTGYVPDEELRHLHSGALALLLPSACEGFGLPAVEAAACGAPVIATVESPLPELLEGGGIFVRPGDAGVLVDALDRLLTDESARQALGRRARKRASSLNWEHSADVTLSTLREAAS
jgi:glycosyltransferase involved in cell wall biosynthesis